MMDTPLRKSSCFVMVGLKEDMRIGISIWHVSKEEAKQYVMIYHRLAEVLLGLGSVPCQLPFNNRGFVSKVP